jgi:hypothetical protein
LGFDQSILVENQVRVYVDNIPQTLGTQWNLEPYDGTAREVIFATEPPIGSEILIYVTADTQCVVNGNQLVFNAGSGLVPGLGDVIAVTTWNDTRQQKVLSQCFVGPITTGIVVNEPYDSTDFDAGEIINAPGSYDYTEGETITTNSLDLGVVITNPDRLWVSVNGNRLFNNQGFIVSGTELILTAGTLAVTDVVMITQFTNAVVPEAMAFRIFQDMRGAQAVYRITESTTTTTTAPVSVTDDVIEVENVAALQEPDLDNNVWGVITIDAERIMYRERNIVNNTVSGLLRGTAGTAITAHAQGATVYNMGRGNLLSEQYQNYVVSTSILADGTQTSFDATNISVTYDSAEPYDSLPYDIGTVTGDEGSYDYGIGDPELAVEVYVGGVLIPNSTEYYSVTSNTVTVTFVTAPPAGVEVTILVRRGVTWYAQGTGTASNGEPLQETDTAAARFLRGE